MIFYDRILTMETITFTVQVPRNIGLILEERAKVLGKGAVEYVEQLIEKDINQRKTLNDILAPIRKNFTDTGMTEGDLDLLIESERQAIWEERNVG